ncbi:Hpa3p [Saccharomyces cerevisiae YJM1573]|uniref:D-amino acid N-acetyltransferase n=1 Tax=Saccharomyces cerevisiae (strain YJM789) TaxID=307796 RepID=A6ZQN5_YEAS7|nr:Hpa3p [Saccharomyces cerevisiae YJM1133]AJU45741.1 Hpa3p [Saccharomyces cerevisiae YJM1273]AJU51336.1 Hpa3p [Saccharomyces cerevisiae YJM1402]AJU52874.1 Hpa3p [Saccharomyces cerevisiae YJM1434]AJU56430.1 Hpa3p [Saccharomyces cerevisiae YJM1573]EDN62905.1 D-amino acid N-acetyltransferase [Saccharomyces cerevisiae YJM789]
MKRTPDSSPPFASTKNVGMSNEEPEKMVNDRIVVKAIEPKDEEAWNKLWKEYQGFQKTVMPPEVATTTFARFIDPTVKLWGALAFDTETGDAIGFAHYLNHLTSWHVEEVVYMNDLYVTERARVKGVGRKLIEFVYSRADELGTPAVYWVTDHYNHRAQLLYTKVAYKTDKVLYKRNGY